MKQLTILIDMDDVLEDLQGCWIAELNRMCNTEVLPEDITEWRVAKFFPQLTEEKVYAPLFSAEMWNHLQPIQNAPEIVDRLRKSGHRILVVTASHYGTLPPKIARFLSLYPCLSWKDIIVASDKSVIAGDVMIDDGPHNLETTTCIKLLFDRPHNRSYDAAGNGMFRVKTWDEIEAMVLKISELAGGIE